MRPTRTLCIPQPCHESWASMMPMAQGRHCAACQKTVVDFTLKTDAEILAYLAGAAGTRTCGRFAAGQLERPLQRAVLAAPTRWRAWLAAAVAVWGLRETAGTLAHGQTPTEWRARYWGGPAPVAPPADTIAASAPQPQKAQPMPQSEASQRPLVMRGTVLDFISKEGLPGVTVLLQGTTIGVSTSSDGSFELVVPDELVVPSGLHIVVSSVGYASQLRTLVPQTARTPQTFRLQNDVKGMMGIVVTGQPFGRPWPWHPRRFYHWSKYWITRPFRND